jgi:hypothetical protein
MVSESRWQNWMAAMAKPFIDGEVRYFEGDDIQSAWDWLQESADAPPARGTSGHRYPPPMS